MFLRITLLLALAAVASAGVGGKSTVVARAKFTVIDDPDGFGYMIKLDGSDSDRECANAGWFVKQGGEYVKITYRMFADYEVGEHSNTYKFRLTVWDPEIEERIDHDYVKVVINGTPKPPKGSKVKADADITKVTETENGHEISLTAKESLNCEETFWEYKPRKGRYKAIGEKETFKYEVLKPGKYKFKLICISHALGKQDIDKTWVKISKCKAPKFPKDKSCKNKGDGKKCDDPCKKVDVKAKADVVDVPRNKKGEFIIMLTANASRDCSKYQWECVRGNGNEMLGNEMTQEYVVDKKGMYKFKVTCTNNKCQDSDSDVVTTDCVATYNPNPCRQVKPIAVAKATGLDKEKGIYTISLSAKGSERCQQYIWERVSGKGAEIISSGDKANAKFKTDKFGKYSFRVTCLHTKCKKEDQAFIKYKIEDPCDSVDPDVEASASVKKDGRVYTIKLSAEGKKCSSYKWIRIGKKDNEVLGEGPEDVFKYKTEKPGLYKFKVKCLNKKCDKSDGDMTDIKIPNPCKVIEPKASAVIKKQEKKNGETVIKLSAADSTKCSSYKWTLVGEGKIGEGEDMTYTTTKYGVFKFKVTCTNTRCDKTNSDSVETVIEDPCNKVEADAVAEVTKVKRRVDSCKILLSAAKSKKCSDFVWYRVKANGMTLETLGEGAEQEYISTKGRFYFRVSCKNNKCNDKDSDVVKIECEPKPNPCDAVNSVAVASVTKITKDNKGNSVFKLSSEGSQDCQSYEWQLVKSSENEVLGYGESESYKTDGYGSFTFKLICKNDKCDDSATDYTSDSIPNPCNSDSPKAVATSSYKIKKSGKYSIKLSAEGSEQCKEYQWELVKPGDDEVVGDDELETLVFKNGGTYKFKLTCISKCKKTSVTFTSVKIEDLCKDIFPDAEASATSHKKSGSGFDIYLTADRSKNCDTYSWQLVKSGSSENIGTGKTLTYPAPSYGSYKFLLTCENTQCDKDADAIAFYEIQDPCKSSKADANAFTKKVTKVSGSEWKIVLSAEGSKNCDSYQWYRVRSQRKQDKLGNAVTQPYTATRRGSYIFRLVCENTRCGSTDTDIAQTPCVSTVRDEYSDLDD